MNDAELKAELDAYNQARNAALEADNLERWIAFAAQQGVTFSSPIVAEINMHKCRTAVVKLPFELRQASARWLRDRGYTAFDDGDLTDA